MKNAMFSIDLLDVQTLTLLFFQELAREFEDATGKGGMYYDKPDAKKPAAAEHFQQKQVRMPQQQQQQYGAMPQPMPMQQQQQYGGMPQPMPMQQQPYGAKPHSEPQPYSYGQPGNHHYSAY